MVSHSGSQPVSSSAPPCLVVPPEQWFTDNVHTHETQLRSYLRYAFPRVGDLDDVVQESFLRVLKAQEVQPIHYARAFLFKIARRIALDIVRRDQRSPVSAVGDLGALGVIEDKPDVAECCSLQEKIDALADAIADLPDRRREIVILCKLRRLPQKLVAATLGLSERTVENQLFRGIRQCRAYLGRRGIVTLFGDEE